MDELARRTGIEKLVEKALEQEAVKGDEGTLRGLCELKEDMVRDLSTVVVLGEFNRGKSTFLNALLGIDFLPTNILPETAVLCAIGHSEEPVAEVVYQSGETVRGEATLPYLSSFSAQAETNQAEKVKYIKLGCQARILSEKLVFIDTPGVDDLNEQRCEVTYNIIPKANAVIFLLDANSPMKKSELEFLQTRLAPMGINNVLFVVNKYDLVDEEEDEGFLGQLQERLEEILEQEKLLEVFGKPKLYPLSASMAVAGQRQNSEALLEASGIRPLEKAILEMVSEGKIQRAKNDSYSYRLKLLLNKLIRSLERERSLKLVDVGELKAARRQLDAMSGKMAEGKKDIAGFVREEKADILAMTDKSLQYFYQRLEEDIIEDIQSYRASDFKSFVEQRITKTIRRELESWVGVNHTNINRLLQAVEIEVSAGISRSFNQQVRIKCNATDIKAGQANIQLSADEVSDASLKAGLVTAGGASLLMLMGGPVLMPFVSMAGFPFMQRMFLENKLEEAKIKAIPEVESQLAKAVLELKKAIHSYIEEQCQLLVKNGEYAFETVLSEARGQLDREIASKNADMGKAQQEIEDLGAKIDGLKAVLEEIA